MHKIICTGNVGGQGYYPDNTGSGQKTLEFIISLASYENFDNLTIDDLFMVMTSTSSINGVNNDPSGNVGVSSYSITKYEPTTGELTYSVTYNASMGRVYYTFDIYEL